MTSKISTPLFASAALLLAAGLVFACADFDMDSVSFSFFAPESSHADEYAPLYRSFHTLYIGFSKDDNLADFDSVNIAEWAGHFGHAVDDSDLAFLVFTATEKQIDTLIRVVKAQPGKGPHLSPASVLPHNSLLRVKETARVTEFLYYLGYAKRCSPFVSYLPEWDWRRGQYTADPRRDSTRITALIAPGMKAAERAKTAFVRARYIFQALRLYFHARLYADCARFAETHRADFADAGSIRWRAMSYEAGALQRIGLHGDANVLFARCYEGCPQLRITAFLSYHPLDGKAFEASLTRAASVRERDVLWQLNGVYGDALASMRAIAGHDPASNLLDLLLVRAISIEEERVMPERWQYSEASAADYRFKRAAVDTALRAFVQRIAATRRAGKPYLWDLASGYLLMLGGQGEAAATDLARARNGAKGDALVLEQVRVIEVLRRIDLLRVPDAAFEEWAAAELRWLKSDEHTPALRADNTLDYARKRLAQLYAANGDTVKAACLYEQSFPDFYGSRALRAGMLAYMDKPRKTAFDHLLLDLHAWSRADIIEYQAVELMYQDRMDEAVAMFESFTGAGDTPLPGDPFVIHLNDCHDCDHADSTHTPYSKLDFARRMLALLRSVKGKDKNSPETALLLANGYYNMTYFGNARRLYETAIGEHGFVSFDEPGDWRKDPMFDCARAATYYRLAMERSSNAEFRARCCFYLAKCEQNVFFLFKPDGYPGDFRAGQYFRQLKAEYAATAFYKEAIRECGYFRTFAER
jgi:hypothetical protein